MKNPTLPRGGARRNNIRQRGSPTKVTLESGHQVEKQEYVYFPMPDDQDDVVSKSPVQWRMVKTSDYHGEHFLYLDPKYLGTPAPSDPNSPSQGLGHWFAMCTCGSPAVIVGPKDAALEDSDCPEQLLVCIYYHNTLIEDGRAGKHADQEGRRLWT